MAWSRGEEEESVTHWPCSAVGRGAHQTAMQTHHNYMQNNQKSELCLPRPPMAFTLKVLRWHDRVGRVINAPLTWVRDPSGTEKQVRNSPEGDRS